MVKAKVGADASELDYQSLQQELDSILLELQQGDGDVDVAMRRYERGLAIIKLLEARLQTAENKITKLKVERD